MMRRPLLLLVGIGGVLLVLALVIFDPVRLFGYAITSTTGVAAPPLGDSAMIRRGAGHYEQVCAQCHGSPERPGRGSHLRLSPPAPELHTRLGERPPVSLFFTVKHGVSGSGMPAWPTPYRDDEVWDMVAFLNVLPELDAARYRDLAGMERVAQQSIAQPLATCVRCHGEDGRGSPDGAFPRLDIQSSTYLYSALTAFRDGERASGFMQSATAGLTDGELMALAEYFGGLEETGPPEADVALVDVPGATCTACHGAFAPAREEFPVLYGQYQPYVDLQLELFSRPGGHRGGGEFAPLMEEVARSLWPRPPE